LSFNTFHTDLLSDSVRVFDENSTNSPQLLATSAASGNRTLVD